MILFVYNANSGKLNALLHTAHKVLSPSTYSCSLCAITHGNLTEHKLWREFKTSLKQNVVMLHKDEFESQYEQILTYPIAIQTKPEFKTIISTEELNDIPDLPSLISLCRTRIT